MLNTRVSPNVSLQMVTGVKFGLANITRVRTCERHVTTYNVKLGTHI